jgi:hypothetical protein
MKVVRFLTTTRSTTDEPLHPLRRDKMTVLRIGYIHFNYDDPFCHILKMTALTSENH